jgi:hypothetical protein
LKHQGKARSGLSGAMQANAHRRREPLWPWTHHRSHWMGDTVDVEIGLSREQLVALVSARARRRVIRQARRRR